MNTSTMPPVIDSYFHLMDGDRKEEAVDLFTSDAQVTDDGTIYRGREEIRSWLTGQASEWVTTSVQLSAERTDQHVVVVIRVEGNFPGGRVDLRNAFDVDQADHIRSLSITA